MKAGARGSSGKAHDSNPKMTRFNENATKPTGLQNNMTALDDRLQEVDISMIEEKVRLDNGFDQVLDGETTDRKARVKTSRSSSFSFNKFRKQTLSGLDRAASSNRHSMIVPTCMTKSDSPHFERIEALLSDHVQPPVTVATLQELDLNSIQNNLNLRIDICHDPDLYFQPISGQKGYTKRAEAKQYWAALATEFEIYQHDARSDCTICQENRWPYTTTTFKPRLPGFFNNLRQIVQMLVPEQDHDEVANHLETDFIMQQVRKGALDPIGLSSWLADLLTTHCAPMRDGMAAMVMEQVREGILKADMDTFMQGLETLLNLLEAMKLDVANHQIRSYRYSLIEGTIEFQRECFSRAIEVQQMHISNSQRWYRLQCFHHQDRCRHQEKSMPDQQFACFIHALVNLSNPLERRVPLTLQHDHSRIMRIQEDLQDHIQMNLCLAVFNRQVHEFAGPRCSPESMHEDLKNRIIFLTEDDEGNGGAISDHLDAIGMEITRAAFLMRIPCGKQPLSLSNFHFNRTIRLLHAVFQEEDEEQTVTKTFLASLEARTMQFAKQFRTMSSLDISNAQKHWARSRAGKDSILAEWDDLARKLAHIGVLHWNVWADLCYCLPLKRKGYSEQDSIITVEHYDPIQSDSSLRRSSLVPSDLDNCKGNMEGCLASEQDTAAMQGTEPHVQRQDSGCAEFVNDLEGHEIEIDLDPGPDTGQSFQQEQMGNSSNKQLSGLR